MKYAIIKDNHITNIIVAEPAYAERISAVYCGDLPVGIGDCFDGQYRKVVADYDEDGNKTGEHFEYYDVPNAEYEGMSPEQIREHLFETEPIIEWQGNTITVDAAVDLWGKYAAENNDIATQLSTLIAAAKTAIREQYPDEEVIENE